MAEREFYGVRKGHIPRDQILSFENLKKAFLLLYKELEGGGYFQKYFGKQCPDGDTVGQLGDDLNTAIYLKTGSFNLWPIYEKLEFVNEIEFYTLVEFLHDCCSDPTDVYFHDFFGCGLHVRKSDDIKGRTKYRDKMNPLLKRYKKLELSETGEILNSIEAGFEPLFNATIPSEDDQNVGSRINSAILKFRRASSTTDDRRDALRDLADVLEFMKPTIQNLPMSKDTNELFQIANTFGIRHHNIRQKTEYDKGTWHSWIFYCYLSTIHLCLRLIKDQ